MSEQTEFTDAELNVLDFLYNDQSFDIVLDRYDHNAQAIDHLIELGMIEKPLGSMYHLTDKGLDYMVDHDND